MKYHVKEHRKVLRLTQEELAKRSGVSRATIIALESGKPYVTTTKTLLSVANALNTTIGRIFYKGGA